MLNDYFSWLRFRASRALSCARAHATARYREARDLPGDLLIIVAPPRSGSTWLFDLMKSMPGARMHPKFDIFAALGLVGRRYPADCTVKEPPCERVETEPKVFEAVPLFAPEEHATPHSPVRWYVEKCHPHFYSYSAKAFGRRLRDFAADWSIRIIYHVRRPQNVFASFFSYQMRNPNWNPGITPALAGRHLLANYRSLEELTHRMPGMLIDYDELRDHPVRTLQQLQVLDGTEAPDAAYLGGIVRSSTWEARRATGTPFVGSREGANQDISDTVATAINITRNELDECKVLYDELLSRRAVVH